MPYYPPVDPNKFGTFSFNLLVTGFIAMSFFVILMQNPKKSERSLIKELFFALISSAFAGVGLMFAIMEFGVFL